MSGDAGPTLPEAPPALPPGVRRVRETRAPGAVPLFFHPEWAEAFPWLVQGTTGRGEEDEPFDLGLFGDAPVGAVLARWRTLLDALDLPGAAHAFQVHRTAVRWHETGGDGVLVMHGYDGHATATAGLLLAVSVADCVPVFLVDPGRRRVAILHGGWRGTAARIVAVGLARLGGSDPAAFRAHLGPAICGGCYEVGPEVHEALGLPAPPTNTPVDVRAVLARQLVSAGLRSDAITVSEHCTRCGVGFFSHRGGDTGRQMGVLGLRP